MTKLSNFLENAKDKNYRDLIQHNIKTQSTEQLHKASLEEISFLPQSITNVSAMDFIDHCNFIAMAPSFWKDNTCKTAFDEIIQEAINDLQGLPKKFKKIEDFLNNEENHEMAFNIFQLITLSYSYSASMSKQVRKQMGIKKGLFG
jgi:hypothetical protein